jgi:hypothetical protein
MTNEEIQQITAKLNKLSLPFEGIKVFGTLRCNIHIKCLGKSTSNKWAEILLQIFGIKADVRITTSYWEAKINKGTCLRPTMRKGYLVSLGY